MVQKKQTTLNKSKSFINDLCLNPGSFGGAGEKKSFFKFDEPPNVSRLSFTVLWLGMPPSNEKLHCLQGGPKSQL